MLNYYDSFLTFKPNSTEIAIIERMGWKGIGYPIENMNEDTLRKTININIIRFIKYNEKTISKLPLSIKTKSVIYAKVSTERELTNMVKRKEIRALIIDVSSLKRVLSREVVNILKQHEDKFLIITLSSLFDTKNMLIHVATIRNKETLLYKLRNQIIFASGANSILYMSSPRIFRDALFEIGIREETIIHALSYNPESLFRMPNPIIVEGSL